MTTLGLKNVNMLSKEQYDGVAEPVKDELWTVEVETYSDDDGNWYRVYPDGWCEQGGYVSSGTPPITVTLLKQMKNTNYAISIQQANNVGGNPQHYASVVTGRTTTSITVNQYSNYFFPYFWEVKGYAA